MDAQEYCDQLINGYEQRRARNAAANEETVDEAATEAAPVLVRDFG